MVQIRGVHLVADAAEPFCLIDVAIDGSFDEVEWDLITQTDPTQPRENWQTVYDEQELGRLPDGRTRAVFFFHYLDASRPLHSPYGELALPEPSAIPEDLSEIEYLEP